MKKCKMCKGSGFADKKKEHKCYYCTGKGFLYEKEEPLAKVVMQQTLAETQDMAKKQFFWELSNIEKTNRSLGISDGERCNICKNVAIELKKGYKDGKIVKCCRACKRKLIAKVGFDVQIMSAKQIAEKLGVNPISESASESFVA